MSASLIRRPAVQKRTGLTTSRMYELIGDGTFPKPVPIGPRAVAWLESEVDEWIDARIAERDTAA